MTDPNIWLRRRDEKKAQGINLQFPLRVAVRMWPTPTVCGNNNRKGATWPTPTASDAVGGPGTSGREGGMNLRTAAWLTPTVNDSKNNAPPSQALRNTPPLNSQVGGPLNPTWVEWLMGWPLGWTDCAASATDRFRQWFALHGRP